MQVLPAGSTLTSTGSQVDAASHLPAAAARVGLGLPTARDACQWELLSKRRRDGPPGGRTASASTWHTGTLSPRVGHSGEKARFGHLTGFKFEAVACKQR